MVIPIASPTYAPNKITPTLRKSIKCFHFNFYIGFRHLCYFISNHGINSSVPSGPFCSPSYRAVLSSDMHRYSNKSFLIFFNNSFRHNPIQIHFKILPVFLINCLQSKSCKKSLNGCYRYKTTDNQCWES